jgi:hypothetical protein
MCSMCGIQRLVLSHQILSEFWWAKRLMWLLIDKTNYKKKKKKKKKMTKQKTADQAWFISGWAWSPD